MSETDSFIQEVSEEVRQDRMFSLWKKWGPFVIGAIAVIVAAAAYWSWTQSKQQAAAEARGGTFIAADPEVLEQQLLLPERIDGAARILAEFAAAGAEAEAGDTEAAAARYGTIASNDAAPQEYRDLAVLQQARLAGGSEAISLLGPLTEAERPFRLLALELRGALLFVAGDRTAAHADWRAIIGDPAATAGLRQRAMAALTATGGDLTDTSG